MELREGIILKSSKYQENSKIIYIITNEGIQSLLVKGSSNLKSRNFYLGNELTKIAFDKVKGKGFDIVTTGKIINDYVNIKQDFNRLSKALQIIEIGYTLSEHIDDYEIFYAFIDQILERINNSKYYDLLLMIFKLKTLYLLGIGPIFTYCVKCHSKENEMFFDFYSGGMVCLNHQMINESIFSIMTIEEIKFLYLTKLEYFNDDVLSKIPHDFDDEIEKFIDLYYNHYLSFKSQVSRVLKKI